MGTALLHDIYAAPSLIGRCKQIVSPYLSDTQLGGIGLLGTGDWISVVIGNRRKFYISPDDVI